MTSAPRNPNELADPGGNLALEIVQWQHQVLEHTAPTSPSVNPSLLATGITLLTLGDFEQRWAISKDLEKLGPAIIPPLVDLWQCPEQDLELRWFAGRLLAQFTDPRLMAPFQTVLADPSAQDLWAIAIQGLAHQGPAVLPLLEHLLAQETTQPLAIELLRQLPPDLAQPRLLTLLDQQDPTLRCQLLQVFDPPTQPEYLTVLVDALTDFASPVRCQALKILGHYLKHHPEQIPDCLPHLEACLDDVDLGVCHQAALSLSQLPSPMGLTALVRTLYAPHTPLPLRLTLIKGLAWMNCPESVQALSALFDHPQYGQSLPDLTQVVQSLGRVQDTHCQAIAGEILLTFAQSDHPYHHDETLASHLCHSWAQLHYRPALPLLHQWSTHESPFLRFHAQAAIDRINAAEGI